jgi:predicted Zn-dependent peptidase
VLNQVMQRRGFGLPADYWDTYAEKVVAVSADDVQRAGRNYVPVERYNSEGRKIE